VSRNDSLSDLKKEIEESKIAQEKWNRLLKQRNELEEAISQLQEEVEGSFFAPDRRSLIEQNKTMLVQIQQKKHEVDHQLDHLEHYTTEYIDNLEQQLVDDILTLYPEEISFHNEMTNALELAQQYHNELNEICHICEQVKQPLEEIEKVLHTIRRRWILSYMFGENPNARILHLLEVTHQTALSALKKIEKHNIHKLPFTTPAKALYQELTALLSKLEIETKRRWNFKTAKTLSNTTLHELSKIENQFKAESQAGLKTKQLLENRKKAWIERLTT